MNHRLLPVLAIAAALGVVLPPTAAHAQASCDRGLFTNQNIGTALGAAVGGLLGSQLGGGSGKTIMTIVGVLGGGVLGNQIGAGMDAGDRGCYAQTLDRAPEGQTVAWHNPDNNRDYRVTPRKDFKRHGRRCREVSTEVMIDGQPQTAEGTACRQKDGSWKFESG